MPSNFNIELKHFESGYSPLAHLDSLTDRGNAGSASVMTNADILDGNLTQGPGLETLTGGNPTGSVSELINYILETPPTDSVSYGIGDKSIYKITPTSVVGDATFPYSPTGMTDGQGMAILGGKLYYAANYGTTGEIGQYDLSTTFNSDWSSTIVTGGTSLQNAPHPIATKEDIMLVGNGRYVAVYVNNNNLDSDKLDFGAGTEVADIVYFANYWYIAVNNGVTGTNRSFGQVYLYDGAATTSTLSDETGIGIQKIGFLYVLNGIIYIAYQDLSSTGGYHIGYISGRQIKHLGSFTGGLPTFAQKTLYRNTILFNANGSLWSCGAVTPSYPVQISQIADGGYATVGAVASPFGTPMVASSGGGSYKLAQFSGYDTNSSWKSVVIPTTSGKSRGYIDDIVVMTKPLPTGAYCSVKLEADQDTRNSTSKAISTQGETRHVFDSVGLGSVGVEDFRVEVDFQTGSATYPVTIKKIMISGHYND